MNIAEAVQISARLSGVKAGTDEYEAYRIKMFGYYASVLECIGIDADDDDAIAAETDTIKVDGAGIVVIAGDAQWPLDRDWRDARTCTVSPAVNIDFVLGADLGSPFNAFAARMMDDYQFISAAQIVTLTNNQSALFVQFKFLTQQSIEFVGALEKVFGFCSKMLKCWGYEVSNVVQFDCVALYIFQTGEQKYRDRMDMLTDWVVRNNASECEAIRGAKNICGVSEFEAEIIFARAQERS